MKTRLFSKLVMPLNALLLGSLVSLPAVADFNCEVAITRVLIYGDGSVNVLHNGRGNYTFICNVKGTWKNIDSITCSHWIALLQNAQQQNKKAIFYYGGDGNCASLPLYGSAPAPLYIGTTDLFVN
jgi:hypothetical protein